MEFEIVGVLILKCKIKTIPHPDVFQFVFVIGNQILKKKMKEKLIQYIGWNNFTKYSEYSIYKDFL